MSQRRQHHGFTLIELMVSIGIVVLLIGIALPIIAKAQKTGRITQCKAELQQISTGLINYHSDFSDYPRLSAGTTPPTGLLPSSTTPIAPNVTGPQLLTWAMMGLGPAISATGQDGNNGPGFRTLTQVQNDVTVPMGRVYGPYFSPDNYKFTSFLSPGIADNSVELLDPWGGVILYYPARAGNPPINVMNSFVADSSSGEKNNAGGAAQPLYDAVYSYYLNPTTRALSNGFGLATAPGACEQQLQILMGDTSHNGQIDTGETPVYTGPYILWSAGPDGTFGGSDDINSFNQ